MNSPSDHAPLPRVTLWLPALAALLLTVALYALRQHDDNSLASWNIMFLCREHSDRFPILFAAALLIAPLAALSPFSLPRRLRPLILFTITAVAAALCWSIPEVNIDASRYFSQAKYLEQYGIAFFVREWGRGIPAWTDLPALPFLYGLLFRLFGETRIIIQLCTAFLFGMTAVQIWSIGRTLWDDNLGFIGGILLLGMPYLLMMTPLMLVDVPTMFFLTLSLALFLKALEGEGPGWTVGASCATAFTVFCKYSALFFLSLLPLVALLYALQHPERRRQTLRNTLFVLIASALLVGSVALPERDVIAKQVHLLLAYQKPGLGRWSESFYSTFFFQIFPLISLAAIVSLFAAAARRDGKYLIIAWLPLLFFLFRIERIRYILPAFPMVALMAAYGLTTIKDRRMVKAIVACAVAASLALCFLLYIPYLRHLSSANLQKAGAFLDTLPIDVVEVVPVPEQDYPINPAIAVPILDLFTQKRIVFTYTRGVSSPDQDVTVTPFRFTWEYANPRYYRPDAATAVARKAIVVISGRLRESLPQQVRKKIHGYAHEKDFLTACPFYEYHTLVKLYW